MIRSTLLSALKWPFWRRHQPSHLPLINVQARVIQWSIKVQAPTVRQNKTGVNVQCLHGYYYFVKPLPWRQSKSVYFNKMCPPVGHCVHHHSFLHHLDMISTTLTLNASWLALTISPNPVHTLQERMIANNAQWMAVILRRLFTHWAWPKLARRHLCFASST